MKQAVTFLIDTQKHDHFIEEALVNMLEQDFLSSELEISVVDEASIARTLEFVRKS